MFCQAWHLCDPDAGRVFQALRRAGVKTAVVSNFDTRLRPLLQALKCDQWFDAVAVSAEVGFHFKNLPKISMCTAAYQLKGAGPVFIALVWFYDFVNFIYYIKLCSLVDQLAGCSRKAKPNNILEGL